MSTRRSPTDKEANQAPLRHDCSSKVASLSFAGRLGGNQEFTINRHDEANTPLLHAAPDAAPGMSLTEQFDLKPFMAIGLWKAAVIEGFATMFLVFLTVWANISPDVLPTPPTPQLGYFDNAAYLGPTTGGLANFLLLTIFIFVFGVVTGAHMNPLITIGTFLARLCSFPRAILYLAFQLLGATLAGLFVRAGYGTRDFKTGGCWMFPDVVPVRDALAVEFITDTAFLFAAFGVGLDPRQRKVIPPALSPFLVGLVLGTMSWVTGYSRFGYGGASLNPARCFGTYVGSHFPYWHWHHVRGICYAYLSEHADEQIQWVATICACILHGIMYYFVPAGVSALDHIHIHDA